MDNQFEHTLAIVNREIFMSRFESCFMVACEALGVSDWRDGKKVYASDHYEAAEKWAAHEDAYSADYWIVGGEVAVVQVIQIDSNENPISDVCGFPFMASLCRYIGR